MLSALAANIVCVGLTLTYIVGFYLFKVPGGSRRDDPTVIKARMKSVLAASILSALCVWQFNTTQHSIWRLLGTTLQPQLNIFSLLLLVGSPLLLTCLLFLGPLSIMFFEHELPFQRHFMFKRDVVGTFSSLIGQRNYVVGPLTEEFVFRSCILATLFQANYSKAYLIFASPLYFGIAHLHHIWENYNAFGKTNAALKRAVFISLFQFCYTTLFGWYASFLFIRTNHIIPPAICHSFCNMMGVPDIGSVHDNPSLQKRRWVIYTCFWIGLFAFISLLYPLTEVGNDTIYW